MQGGRHCAVTPAEDGGTSSRTRKTINAKKPTFSFSHMSRDELAQSMPWREDVPGVVFLYDGELFPGESVTERTMQSIEYIYIIIDKNICR